MTSRYERQLVWENTVELCTTGQFKDLQPGNSEHFKHDDPTFAAIKLEKKYQTKFSVLNDDVLLVAELLHKLGENNVLVLNLASYKHQFGGVKNGAMAQEEELGRRTNYFKTNSEKFYPFKKMEAIYTPNVTVIKNMSYNLIAEPFSIGMLAVSAIKDPILLDGNVLNSWDYQVTCNTIDNLFKVALLKKHEVLVLGALGCGAFHNDANEITKIFNIYLEKYNGCFKTIVFAVLSRSDNNFDIFNTQIKRNF